MAKDIHSLSKNMLGAVAWPDRLDYRTGQPAARPAAKPSDRFMPPAPAAAAPGAPSAPVQAADLRRQREELAERAWPDGMNFTGASQQAQDDEDPDSMSEEEELETLEFAIKASQDRLAILRERLQAKAMAARSGT